MVIFNGDLKDFFFRSLLEDGILSGWWFQPTPLKNMEVSWDDVFFPTEWKVIKFHGSSHHQPGYNGL